MVSTVVMLASLGRPASDFTDLSERLASVGFTPLAIEPARSAPAGSTLLDLASAVLVDLDGRGVGEFHLIGHAFGNRLARAVTAIAPERVATLTLLACGGYVEMPAAAAAALGECFTREIGTPEHLDAVRRGFFSPGHDPSIWRDGWMPEVAAYQSAAVARTDRAEWWDATAARVLVIQGLDDAIAPPENGRRYCADHREVTTLVEIADAGHALIVEQPDVVASHVIEFLSAN